MCYVCNCFGWTLDLFQRILTFFISCWLAFAVCCGLSIATIAGIAYGYNYCLAEYITLTRSDIRVYMRRGQFYDKPELKHPKRRMGGDDEVFPYNPIDDYQQEIQPNEQNPALSDKWIQDQELRKYAEKLTKYESRKTLIDASEQREQTLDYKFEKHLPTTILHSGSSDIVIRLFEPVTLQTVTLQEQTHTDKEELKVNAVLDKALRKTTEEYQDYIPPNTENEDSLIRKQMKKKYRITTQSNSEQSNYVDENNAIYSNV